MKEASLRSVVQHEARLDPPAEATRPPAPEAPAFQRTRIERFRDAKGFPIMDVEGDHVVIDRMTHDRHQTMRLTLALLEHLAGTGGPLEYIGGALDVVRSEIRNYLSLPF